MIDYEKLRLRQAFYEDVHQEIVWARRAIVDGRKPRVGQGFQFWIRHEPRFLDDLDKAIQRACRRCEEEERRESDRVVELFAERIVPALAPRPIETDGWVRQARLAMVPAEFEKALTGEWDFEYKSPLTAEDFLAPIDLDTANDSKLLSLVRLYPIVLRGYHNVERYPSPFSQRGDGFECADGWLQPISEFIDWLENEAVASKRGGLRAPLVGQIKEKLGGLKIYLTNCNGMPQEWLEECRDRKFAVITKAAQTCESCGEPGIFRQGPWVHTYCDTCENIYQNDKGWRR